MKILRLIGRVLDRLDSLLAAATSTMIVLIGLAMILEVVMRYLFDKPTVWTVELSRFALLYITFLGASWVLRQEAHVKIDMVLDMLNPRNRALLNMVTSLFCAAICLVLVWYGAKVSVDSFQTGYRMETELRTPQVAVIAVIPVGMFLFLFGFVKRTYRYLRQWRELGLMSQEKT